MTIKKSTEHPTRQQLIEAATGNRAPIADHLNFCDDCRSMVELFSAYRVSGQLPLTEAPEAWIVRAESIMSLPSLATRLRSLAEWVSFDSWVQPSVAGIRSAGATAERRIRFEASPLVFDVRVEKHGKTWNGIAQVSLSDQSDVPQFTLVVNNRPVAMNDDGFFQWSSSQPPHALKLRTGDVEVTLPEISWKPKSPK